MLPSSKSLFVVGVLIRPSTDITIADARSLANSTIAISVSSAFVDYYACPTVSVIIGTKLNSTSHNDTALDADVETVTTTAPPVRTVQQV